MHRTHRSLTLATVCSILFATLGWSPADAGAQGYAGLGPRGRFFWADYATLPPSLWSGQIVVKLSGEQPTLRGRRILDRSGRVLLDLDRELGRRTVLGVSQGFGGRLGWLRSLQLRGERRCGCEVADLTTYFSLRLDRNAVSLPALLGRLNALRDVELAYPVADRRLLPPPVDIPPTTPSYAAQQGYGDPAPDGIDVGYAAGFPGGDGAGVGVGDVEIGWEWTHEDLESCAGGLVNVGTLYTDEPDYIDHGTAVLGMIFAGDNGYGVTGLAPAAGCHFAPDFTQQYGSDVARAIVALMDSRLDPGDVILLEAQTYGPNFDENTYAGLIPVEWEPAIYDTIRTAATNGYLVVEAGANGWEDLDDPIYNDRFDRAQYDSGALMVAAGTPPTDPPGHVPEWFTNWGSRMDLHAWGSLVVTTGYGDLFNGGGDVRQRYTSQFGGTSSASPIVTGAVAIFSAVIRALGIEMTPVEIRDVLAATGTPQYPDAHNIGTQPDLRAALDTLAICGNGEVEGAEACDDGNTVDGDGCSADCRSDETCGNNLVDTPLGETCDDGSYNSDTTPDSCRTTCRIPTCGDGVVDPAQGEECDDGNTLDGDACPATCRFPDEGCGCASGAAPLAVPPLLLLGLLVGWFLRRRVRAPRPRRTPPPPRA